MTLLLMYKKLLKISDNGRRSTFRDQLDPVRSIEAVLNSLFVFIVINIYVIKSERLFADTDLQKIVIRVK